MAYTVFLLIGVVFSGVFVEPMLVFGSDRFKGSTQSYLSRLVWLHWKWGWMGSAILVGTVSVFYRQSPSFSNLIVLALVAGLILFQWLLRRACYINFQPRLAAEGGLVYLGSMILGLWLMQAGGFLTAINGILAMALCSFLAGRWIQSRIMKDSPPSGELVTDREILKSHWDYGRWAVLVNVLSWIPSNIYLLILPLWAGEVASAELKASFNLVLPVQQLLAAVGPLLLPALVRARTSPAFFSNVLKLSVILALLPLLWTTLLFFYGDLLADLFYDGKYGGYRNLLLFLGLQSTMGAVVLVVAGALRAMELPKLVSYGYFAAALFCLVAGLPFTAKFGVTGAAAGMFFSMLFNVIVLIVIFLKYGRGNRPLPASSSS